MNELIKISSFGSPNKVLKIQDNELQFDTAKIQLLAVNQFKYGIEPIQVDMFYVGSKFTIELRSIDETIKIDMKSYFGFSKSYFNNLFNSILKVIWQETAVRIIEKTIDKILINETVEIGKCKISVDGVLLNNFLITWPDLTYQKNYNKLTINSKSNSKVWTNLYYIQDYNVDVLIAVLDWIFKYNGLEEIEERTSHNSGL